MSLDPGGLEQPKQIDPIKMKKVAICINDLFKILVTVMIRS